MLKFICPMVLALAILSAGCLSKKETFEEGVAPNLPPNVKNVEGCGNRWFTFEMEVGGKNRLFLGRVNQNSHGSIYVITELSK